MAFTAMADVSVMCTLRGMRQRPLERSVGPHRAQKRTFFSYRVTAAVKSGPTVAGPMDGGPRGILRVDPLASFNRPLERPPLRQRTGEPYIVRPQTGQLELPLPHRQIVVV